MIYRTGSGYNLLHTVIFEARSTEGASRPRKEVLPFEQERE